MLFCAKSVSFFLTRKEQKRIFTRGIKYFRFELGYKFSNYLHHRVMKFVDKLFSRIISFLSLFRRSQALSRFPPRTLYNNVQFFLSFQFSCFFECYKQYIFTLYFPQGTWIIPKMKKGRTEIAHLQNESIMRVSVSMPDWFPAAPVSLM